MNRNMLLTLAASLLALALSSPAALTPAAAKTHNYYFDFEQTLEPWAAGGDLGSKGYLKSVAGENGCPDMRGDHYAQVEGAVVGKEKDIPLPVGTWTVASFPAARAFNTVSVEWNARSTRSCEGCVPLVYVGTSAPTHSSQFSQAEGEAYLKEAWQSFRHDTMVSVGDEYTVFVAIGWNGTDAGIGLDCVNVTIIPLD